jgi:hypothetical protein
MKAYVLRIIYQHPEVDVFKDIAFSPFTALEDVHQTIVNAFGIESFIDIYFSLCDDDWKVVERYDLDEVLNMHLSELVYKKGQRMLYENGDSEWKFDIELLDIYETEFQLNEAAILEEYGLMPDTAPSDLYNPERYLLENSKTKYKKDRVNREDLQGNKEEGDFSEDKDITDFF